MNAFPHTVYVNFFVAKPHGVYQATGWKTVDKAMAQVYRIREKNTILAYCVPHCVSQADWDLVS